MRNFRDELWGEFGFGGVPIQVEFNGRRLYTSVCTKCISILIILLIGSYSIYELHSWYQKKNLVFQERKRTFPADHVFAMEAQELLEQANLTYYSLSGVWSVISSHVKCKHTINASMHPENGISGSKYEFLQKYPTRLFNCRLNCSAKILDIIHEPKWQYLAPSLNREGEARGGDRFDHRLYLPDLQLGICEKSRHRIDEFDPTKALRSLHTISIISKTNSWNLSSHPGQWTGWGVRYQGIFEVNSATLESSLTGYTIGKESISMMERMINEVFHITQHITWQKIVINYYDKWFGFRTDSMSIYSLERVEEDKVVSYNHRGHRVELKNHLQRSYVVCDIYPLTIMGCMARIGGVTSFLLGCVILLRVYNGYRLQSKIVRNEGKVDYVELKELFHRVKRLEEQRVYFREEDNINSGQGRSRRSYHKFHTKDT